jgi:hypothetical protein
MMLQGPLGQPQWQVPPDVFMPSSREGGINAPLLGNAYIQSRAPVPDADAVIEMYRILVTGALPGVKLAMWKRQKFKEAGRQQRIETSLVALNGPQPTTLTAIQWKTLLEEIEEED